jgi:hypothetical protein
MVKSVIERKQAERKRMRAAGFVLFQAWVRREDRERVRNYISRLNKRDKESK